MAMTIKQKVSFEVSIVVDTETQEGFIGDTLAAIRDFSKGQMELSPLQRHVAKVFLEKGEEAAISELLASNMKDELKTLMKLELGYDKLSPVVVRNV